jgi:hypothetical protein
MATLVELGAVEGFILDDIVAGVLDNEVFTLWAVSYSKTSLTGLSVSVLIGVRTVTWTGSVRAPSM